MICWWVSVILPKSTEILLRSGLDRLVSVWFGERELPKLEGKASLGS